MRIESGLGKEAQKLLIASYQAQLNQGKMFRLDTMRGTIVQSGSLKEQGLAWRLALDELEETGFARRESETLYVLTRRGVEEAALLLASTDTAPS